ncbi:MAG: translation elongation factor Ts [Acholeplasmatales bacterium]|jgi:elongation factor Ts|nr:translation elongation factor Ts [Acholeplasmatales bacterium]
MEITAKLVAALREQTGAGLMDCKRALVETEGDIEKAIVYLREKGIAKAAKKADRIAAEGLCNVLIDGNYAAIYELNSETDFVARNEKFLELLDKVGLYILANKATSVEEALSSSLDGKVLNDVITDNTATIGEKLSLRRVQLLTKKDDEVFGSYKHNGGKIAVVTVVKGSDTVAKEIALQVSAMKPRYKDRSEIDPEFIASETEIIRAVTIKEFEEAGKDTKNVENVVSGRVSKSLKEICLFDQVYIREQKLTVSQYLSQEKSSVVTFVRLEVGEGIVKKVSDFRQEVLEATSK